MKKYSLINNILGWVVFLIASIVYLVTAEPTASWWDCGEYIATAYKFQVGHPPGAPTFQLFARIFSLFAGGDVTKVAYMVNAVSAICSGFTILFLFWSINMLAKKLVAKTGEITTAKTIAILGSGLVGALAYTFSDTFWYSAVEGEVYAMSSFFTALVFWAILKWEANSDDTHNLRWIILIAFLVGISIGVHLLNLLAIPAMSYVWYFKKYPKTTKKGFIWAGILSFVIVGVVLYFVVPMIVNLAGKFEVFFVNSIKMPFNSGTIFFFLLVIGFIVWGLYWSKKKVKPLFNTIILSFLFLLIGYSTFFILVIRANSNTPINENAPKDAVALLTYLNREQYGDTPLLYGQYYNAQAIEQKDGSPKYIKDTVNDQYIAVRSGGKVVYEPNNCTTFPRMYSNDEGRKHVTYYKYWAGINGDRKPTFGENLTYFFRYQVNHMYWRYFMWNFTGRQNDIQGFGLNHSNFDAESNGKKDVLNGNWISGINFIDEMRLGPQSNLPAEMANNPGRNKLFFLPFILGICGLVYQYKKDKKDTFVVFMLFFMTGFAIALYLNMPPQQPRERDYAFAGSFYAFSIWIGLGVLALYEWLKKVKMPENVKAIGITAVCLVAVPVLMATQEWDDHDRSGRYMAREFARNYLESCEKDAILITFGDNDTFPLWYAQEVEGIRPDVRILNYTLSGMHWYVEQLYNKVYDSEKCPFTLTKNYYGVGSDVSFIMPESDQEVEFTDMLKRIMTDPATTRVSQSGDTVKVLLANKFKITLSDSNVISWTIPVDQNGMRQIIRNELMFLDILSTNKFKRPIYVMNPGYMANIFPSINEYIRQEGILYRIMPYKTNGSLDHEKTYNLLMNKFNWGGVKDPKTYLEDAVSINNSRNMRQQYMLLAKSLTQVGQRDKAIKALDKGLVEFPESKIPFDKYDIGYAAQYCESGNMKKGEEMFNKITDLYINQIKYFNRFKGKKAISVASSRNEALQFLAMVYSNAIDHKLTALQAKIKAIPEVAPVLGAQEMQKGYNDLVQKVNTAIDLAQKGNKADAETLLSDALNSLEAMVSSNSPELMQHAGDLILFAFSNSSNLKLEKITSRMLANPTFKAIIEQAMQQQQQQAMQQQSQGGGAPGSFQVGN
ncbi:MAG: rane protein [Bacteroidetes bacterium]|nr:rane protein [Bacteroidota bacterium]